MSDSVLNAPYIRLIADGRKSICDAFFADPEITPTELVNLMKAQGVKTSVGACARALKSLRDYAGVATTGAGRAAERTVPPDFDAKRIEYQSYIARLVQITHSLAPAPAPDPKPEPEPAPAALRWGCVGHALSPQTSAVLKAAQLCAQLAELIKQGHIKNVTVYRDECSDGEPISQNIVF